MSSELGTVYRDIAEVKDALGISDRVIAIEMYGPRVVFKTDSGEKTGDSVDE